MHLGRNGLPIVEDSPTWDGDRDDTLWELRFIVGVVPVVSLLAWLATQSAALHSVGRIFFSMWLHELGHATAAWFGGFWAMPGPWRTMIAAERSWGVAVGLTVAIAVLGWYGHITRRRPLVVAAAGLVIVEGIGHLVPLATMRAFISFFGDGGCMVFGTLLVLRFFAGERVRETKDGPQRTWLRWGLVVIGAFGLADATSVWLAARGDLGEIPFGHIEGVGLSDPSVLVDVFGWSTQQLVSRYVGLAAMCWLAVAVGQVVGTRRAWLAHRSARALQR